MAVLQLLQRMKMRQFYPIVLLVVSNIFMTFAWYGHLKYKSAALWTVILASWGIAFFEYCFQVPANRIGHDYFSAPQLKIMQEIITLAVFAVFSALYLKEGLKWNDAVGFLLLLLAAFFVFKRWDKAAVSAAKRFLRKRIKRLDLKRTLRFML